MGLIFQAYCKGLNLSLQSIFTWVLVKEAVILAHTIGSCIKIKGTAMEVVICILMGSCSMAREVITR